MKQKYTITVADMEMNIVTDAEAGAVEAIVSRLDHRMRDITEKSHSCSKTEAAVLCALDFCAECAQLDGNCKSLEGEIAEANKTLEALRAKLKEQKDEIDRLKNDNDVMHTILERAAATNNFTAGNTPASTEDPQLLGSNAKPEAEKKEKNRNRVGNMFDLLTFSDL